MFTMGLFQNIGVTELILILAVVLLLFGSTKLPALARSLGGSVNEFKKGMKEGSAGEEGEKTEEPGAEKAEKK